MNTDEETMSRQEQEMHTIHLSALLLKAVWSQIDSEYKSKYRAEIWTQFENTVAAIARMSSTLPKFLSSLCSKFQVATPGRDEAEREHVMRLLSGGYGETARFLKMLREYPQVCVLEVRVMNDTEKEERNYAASSR